MQTIETFLEENALLYGYWYGVQSVTEAVRRLEQEGDRYAASRLTGQEYALYLDLRPARRQAEWLAGRMAARQALEMASQMPGGLVSARSPHAVSGTSQTGEASVLNLLNGAPYFDGFPGLRLSLSHSHALAVAVVSTKDIGVDLEKIESRPAALAAYFFCLEEKLWVEANSEPLWKRDELITRLWSRKEALAKYLSLGSRMESNQVNALPDLVQINGVDQVIRLISGTCEGYCISLAL